jgi:multidrug efflux pump
MGGLFVATFLTLLFLPALYALWFRRSLDARGASEAAPTVEAELAPASAGQAAFGPEPGLVPIRIAAE